MEALFTLPVEKIDSELHGTVNSVEYQDILLVLIQLVILKKQTEYIKES